MTKSKLVDRAFDDLAHSLRVLLEANYKANRGGLLLIDRAEAVGNIETGLTSALNAFHSLYDALREHPKGKAVSWYDNGALATVLAIRNARHHNKANKIRTLYTYHVQEARRLTEMEMYVLVDFPSPDPTASTFDVYLSWFDFRILLSMPEKESRIVAKTRSTIERYLGCAKFAQYASYYDQSESRVFFNVIPLLVNAGMTIVPAITGFLETLSMEGKTFVAVFGTPEFALTDRPNVNCGPFVLPG
jgi:hypothetical protein